jgi:hypothetical protein
MNKLIFHYQGTALYGYYNDNHKLIKITLVDDEEIEFNILPELERNFNYILNHKINDSLN